MMTSTHIHAQTHNRDLQNTSTFLTMRETLIFFSLISILIIGDYDFYYIVQFSL
jgi:hypothetical protein